MDILPLAGMLFSLLVVLIIAGSILMFPVMRRLGRLLEVRLEERQSGGGKDAEIASLRAAVEDLEGEVARLSERQAFTERLLSAPRGGDAEGAVGSAVGTGRGEGPS